MIGRVIVLDCYAEGAFRPDPEERWLPPLPPQHAEIFRELGGGLDLAAYSKGPSGWGGVYGVDRCDSSQFDTLSRLLGEGRDLPAPVAAFALEGREFHGHRGRPWSALRGNLHLSVALRPPSFPAQNALAFVVLPAVAVVDAIHTVTGGTVVPEIKWVNDLLVDGAKLAGVLTATASQGELLSHAVLGIGLNVERTPEVAATPFVPAVTSLAEQGKSLCHRDLVSPLLDAIRTRYEELLTTGPKRLIEAYTKACGSVGREVVIYPEGIDDRTPLDRWPEPIAKGRVEAIGDDLSLILSGRSEPVTRGRLMYAP